MTIELAHNPSVTQGNHPLIHVDQFGVPTLGKVDCRQRSAVMIQAMIFEGNGFTANQLDQAVFRNVAPGLPILRAIDRVEPNADSAPFRCYIDGIPVYHTRNSCREMIARRHLKRTARMQFGS
jgi:hypothetical protein